MTEVMRADNYFHVLGIFLFIEIAAWVKLFLQAGRKYFEMVAPARKSDRVTELTDKPVFYIGLYMERYGGL